MEQAFFKRFTRKPEGAPGGVFAFAAKKGTRAKKRRCLTVFFIVFNF
jgi:hypothetical protein